MVDWECWRHGTQGIETGQVDGAALDGEGSTTDGCPRSPAVPYQRPSSTRCQGAEVSQRIPMVVDERPWTRRRWGRPRCVVVLADRSLSSEAHPEPSKPISASTYNARDHGPIPPSTGSKISPFVSSAGHGARQNRSKPDL
jgi:hypothetical protein